MRPDVRRRDAGRRRWAPRSGTRARSCSSTPTPALLAGRGARRRRRPGARVDAPGDRRVHRRSRDASCDRVASLCTLRVLGRRLAARRRGARDPSQPDARRCSRGTRRTHPRTRPRSSSALRDVGRASSSTFLARCLATPDAGDSAALGARDAARRGALRRHRRSYWAAMVVERPIGARARPSNPSDVLAAVRDACQRALEPWTAADGTMRIPVRATLWCSRSGSDAG